MDLRKQLKQLMSIVLVLVITTGYAQKWNKMIDKAEAKYVVGDYAKAVKLNEKLRKKAVKKLGPANNYIAVYHLNAAKYNLSTGDLRNFDSDIEAAISISEKSNASKLLDHALILLDATNILIRYGNFAKAKIYLDQSEKIFTDINKLDEFKPNLDISRAQIYTGQGYYAEALKLIEDNYDYYSGRAVSKETKIDEKTGKLKSIRLSDEEVSKRFMEFAMIRNLQANAQRKQGDFRKADPNFDNSADWIGKNVGRGSIVYVENVLRHGRFLEENGNTSGDDEKKFERALSLIKKDHRESHYLALDIYESLLKNYLLKEKRSKYKNLRSEYERVIKKYFVKSSMHYINLNSLEFDSKLNRDKTKNLENSVASILATRASLPLYHEKRIELLEFLYLVSLTDKKYSNGETYLSDILNVKKELYGEESPEYHLTRIKLANHYLDFTNKIKEAEEIYNTSWHDVVEKEILPGHIEYVEILNHLAKFYESNDRYDLASSTLDNALEATRDKYDNEDVDYGVELEKIANLQIKIGEYDKAQANLDIAVGILEGERRDKFDVIHYVKVMETNAKLNAIKGLFDEAETGLNRSQRFLYRAKSTVDYDELSAAEELASIYIDLGRYSRTESLLKDILADKEKIYGPSSRNLISPLTDYGKLLLIKGDYTDAEKTARKALTIGESTFGESSSKLAGTLSLLGEIFTTIGDYDKAEDNVQRAIDIQVNQFGREHIDVAKSLSQLALIKFYKNDDPKDVQIIFEEARNIIAKKLGNRNPKYAELLKNLAVLYIATNRYDDAFNALGLAENIWVKQVGRRNNINAASIYMLTGDIHYQQRSYAKAEEEYQRAKRLYEKFFNDNHPEYVKILSKLSKVYYMEGDARKAKRTIDEAIANYDKFIKELFPALSEREKAKFWNTIKGDYEFYNTLAVELRDEFPKLVESVFNNALSTKALLLNSSIKVRERILNSGDPELIATYNDWLSKKEILTNALSMGIEQLAENELDPATLTAEVELLEKELSEKSELFGNAFEEKRITWENVKESLQPNEVALEMVRFRYFDHIFTDSVIYMGLYVKNDGQQKKPDIFLMNNGEDLEGKFFKFYRNSIIFKIEDRFSYDAYWKPLTDHVGSTSTVYLSADGVYNQINLEAIPTGDGKYVIDNSNIILVSNTKDIYLNKVKTDLTKDAQDALMFGNPEFYMAANASKKSNIGQLPGTEREIKELKSLFGQKGWKTDDYIRTQATEPQVRSLDNPRVLHFATHGFFTPSSEITENQHSLTQNEAQAVQNPLLRTGLLLRGAGDLLDQTQFNYNMDEGILTAYEAMNLNLDQTDLVVLSACETGLGDLQAGEGVYGLQRAFMVAGARTLIMSMFKVNDEATQKLMVKFYQKWLETGNKRESFVEAKKELRNEYKDPIFWGAFIMIGLD